MQEAFSISEVISTSWVRVKAQLSFFVIFTICILIFEFINGYLQEFLKDSDVAWGAQGLYFIIVFVIALAIGLFQIRLAIDIADGKRATTDALKEIIPLIGKALVVQIIYGIIVLVGTVLLIIPGIYWAIKYEFALYFVVDKNMSVFEALEESGKITKGVKLHLIGYSIVLMLIAIAGFIALGVGLLIALPIIMVSGGLVYRKLQAYAGGSTGKVKLADSTMPTATA